ncbi:type-F conjugative transfer system pilin assembly protein TrbC [Thiotrichales bacterium 19S11-10]|nr:type-F conjugative transfer system pilin assembly protein TrbC [Thiotrichales bacterium 19S11-10]
MKHVQAIILYVILSFSVSVAMASDLLSQKDLNELNQSALNQAKSYQSLAISLDRTAHINAQKQMTQAQKLGDLGLGKFKTYQSMLDQFQSQYKKEKYLKKRYQGFIIFASLGMPMASLKALVKQADQYGVPVVIQGLYQDSLKVTTNKIFELVKPEHKGDRISGGIMIDPNWFKVYQIKKVPAFMVTNEIKPCKSKFECKPSDYDILYGNISINDALRIFKKKGSDQFQPTIDHLIAKGASTHA